MSNVMHSIDAQQPESNHEDLTGERALAKMRELIKRAPTCFFCTQLASGGPFATRPMSVQQVDEQGALWFLAPGDGGLSEELASDGAVQLLFQASAHVDFMTVYGRATRSVDTSKIHELWEPILKTWFTGGPDDPRIVAVRVDPERGYYWATKNGRAVAFAKVVVGAITGNTLDDSMQGTLRL